MSIIFNIIKSVTIILYYIFLCRNGHKFVRHTKTMENGYVMDKSICSRCGWTVSVYERKDGNQKNNA